MNKRFVLAAALFVVFACVGMVLSRPNTFTVQRSVLVPVRPEVAFEKINSLHAWPAWSKWGHDRVPASDALSGPPSGVGAIWSWQPNHTKARAGLEIVAVTQDKQVVMKVLGDSPAKPRMIYDLAPEGTGTRLTVRFTGDLELIGKVVSIVKPPEAVVGPSLDRELGLFAASASP